MGKLRLGCQTACPRPSQAVGLGSGLTLVAQSMTPTALWEKEEGRRVWSLYQAQQRQPQKSPGVLLHGPALWGAVGKLRSQTCQGRGCRASEPQQVPTEPRPLPEHPCSIPFSPAVNSTAWGLPTPLASP